MTGLKHLFFLLWLISPSSTNTPFTGTLNSIKTIGEHPQISLGELKPFVLINTPDNHIWLFQRNGVWKYDQTLTKWSYYGSIEYEDPDVMGAYNPYNEEFIFWSRGVGKVYTWKPGNNVLKRIDRSDLHKTQYGHFGFVNPGSGNIYAFGGSGFWQDRSFILEFDQKAREWNIVPLKVFDIHPRGRRDALGMYDSNLNQLHIFGGYANPYERHDKGNQVVLYEDYWVFDLNLGTWSQKDIYGKISTPYKENYFPKSNFISTNDFDRENELIWYLASVNHSDKLQLLVYDIKRDFGAFLPVYIPTSNLRSVSFDKMGNQLILHNLSQELGSDSAIIETLAYPLPSANDTRAMMDSIRDNEAYSNRIKIFSGILIIVIPLGLFITLLIHKSRKKTQTALVSNNHTPQKSVEYESIQSKGDSCILIIKIEDPIEVVLNGENVSSRFTHPELDIFIWLAWKNSIGESFQSNQIIEQIFWSDSTNPDYTRKQRNLTMNRLHDQLDPIFSKYTTGKSVLVTRSAYNDKRKKEYGLDFHSIELKVELGQNLEYADEHLVTEKKRWLEIIKAEHRQ